MAGRELQVLHGPAAGGKPQAQALERAAPVLPLRPAAAEKRSHGYIRHGTATLFAAVEVATGKVTGACCPRHRHAEFGKFLRQVAAAYPRVPLHIVCDNYGTHKHPDVRAWLARHPRITLHFTPAPGSWLNMVEIFFSIITRQAIRRGSSTPVKDLIAAIETFTDGWNDRCHPFTWTKTADELLPHCRPVREPRSRDTRAQRVRRQLHQRCRRLTARLCLHHRAAQVFLTAGHDEYWSSQQRVNVTAARDAGVNLAFFTGNEIFWKTRFEPSIDSSNTRTGRW